MKINKEPINCQELFELRKAQTTEGEKNASNIA